MKRFPILVWISAGFAALGTAPRAFATAELMLSDGAGHTATIVATSCGPGCELASFSGALGDWNINTTTGTAAPGGSPLIDLDTINHHNASLTPSTLTIAWSEDNLSPTGLGFEVNIGGTLGPNGVLTTALYGGTSNTEFDLSNQIGSTLTFTSPPVSFSATQTTYLSAMPPHPYALTEVATLTFGTSAGQASFDYSVDTVPEPAAVLLLGTALLLTARGARRRIRRT